MFFKRRRSYRNRPSTCPVPYSGGVKRVEIKACSMVVRLVLTYCKGASSVSTLEITRSKSCMSTKPEESSKSISSLASAMWVCSGSTAAGHESPPSSPKDGEHLIIKNQNEDEVR